MGYRSFDVRPFVILAGVAVLFSTAGWITMAASGGEPVQPYEDVRWKDLTGVPVSKSVIPTLWLNEATIWPNKATAQTAQRCLLRGRNPGLGVRGLHARGITGEGVTVAIIDQNMCLDHPEFEGKVLRYRDFGCDMPPEAGSMHGPAVTSLLVGTNIGTAPGAVLYYAAVPSWKADARYYARALRWLVKENRTLPKASKIRAVSVSAAPSGPGTPFDHNKSWDDARKAAEKEGLLVLDCTEDRGIITACYYDPNRPDDIKRCTPGFPGQPYDPDLTRIHVPNGFRTQAEEYEFGQTTYQYMGRGGLSWAIPYFTGVLALGWQVKPGYDGASMVAIAHETAYKKDGLYQIVDPVAFIARLQGE